MFDSRQIRLLFLQALCIASTLLFSLSFSKTHAFDASRVVEVSLGGSTIINMKPKSATLTDQTIAEIDMKPMDDKSFDI